MSKLYVFQVNLEDDHRGGGRTIWVGAKNCTDAAAIALKGSEMEVISIVRHGELYLAGGDRPE